MTGSSQESLQAEGVACPLVGTRVRLAMTKWGDLPHWEFEGVFLGSDEHGDWIGIPAGTSMSRPGADYTAPVDQVSLVPGPGTDLERSFLATFHAVGGPVRVYVDMTSPPRWDGITLHAVDLDLDVVRGSSGRIWIDDEDEFAEHRVSLGYPDRVVAVTSASCDRIHALVTAGAAPFDEESPAPWFAMLGALVTDRPSPGGPRAV